MAMSHTHHARHAPRRRKGLLWRPVAVLAAGVIAAAALVTYILWPRWPTAEASLDAPSLPITVSGVNFNIPPAAIRNKVQRKPGMQERVDLVFLWPSLTPPDPATRAATASAPAAMDRVFVTIAGQSNALAPEERFNSIYPRYFDTSIATTPSGLTLRPFKDGTPYQGEDMLYDGADPGRFLARCSRDGTTIGMCLYERRIAQADVTFRFPREWLADWTAIRDGMEMLLARLRGAPR